MRILISLSATYEGEDRPGQSENADDEECEDIRGCEKVRLVVFIHEVGKHAHGRYQGHWGLSVIVRAHIHIHMNSHICRARQK